MGLKRKEPAAGGGAAGSSKDESNGWEEECRCSAAETSGRRREGFACLTIWEEVNRFDKMEDTLNPLIF
jgi:hypothetical protein